MSERRALSGDFADIRTVKSRSVVQVLVEFPIEQGEAIVKMFGFPQPSNPVKLALARLAEAPQIEATSNVLPGPRRWTDLTPTIQAGIRCNEPAFQRFLREEGQSGVNDEATAATYVRFACGVNSRADLKGKSAQKWGEIDRAYEAWLRTPV